MVIVIDGNKNKIVNAQEWLNDNFPTKEERTKQQSLIFLGKYARTILRVHVGSGFEQVTLEGELDLNEFIDLKKLVLNGQLVSELKISHCLELESLVINSTDLLSEVDISNNSHLYYLDCTDNEQLASPIGQLEIRISSLEGLLDKTREEFIVYKLKVKERKLENFAQKLGVNREKIRNLCKYYQKLIREQSRKSFDSNVVMSMEDEIEKIKDELLNGGWFTWKVGLRDAQKLCRKCEKIAKLRVEREKFYQRQFEARQEVPLRNNN